MFSKEFRVGLFSLISITVLYVGFNYLKGTELWSSTITYQVNYKNIMGLTLSNPVKVNGITVGRVSGIEFVQEKESYVKVFLEVDKTVYVNKGTAVLLTDDGLINGKMLELLLTPGTGNDADRMPRGSLLQDTVAKGLMQVAEEKAMPLVHDIDSAILTFKSMAEDIKGFLPRVNTMINNISTMSANIATIASQNTQNINALLSNLNKTSTAVTSLVNDKLNPLMSNANTFVNTLNTLQLATTLTNLNTTISGAQTAIAKLNSQDGTVGKLINSTSLHDSLTMNLSRVNQLLIDIQEDPGKYVHLSVWNKTASDENKKLKKTVDKLEKRIEELEKNGK